ncbi:putative protein [Streptomyces sp. enrichment culture]|uniref:DUF1707 SHOCT-like domain-containing protein n=1 Tax=Streptomyces sp. enrichment culture TaxID=1795815 RepID=UPI003F5741AE
MMSELPEVRASDAEREQYAEILRRGLAEGRLVMEEFDERLTAVYEARTRAELEPLIRDLPERVDPPAAAAPAGASVPAPATGWAARIGHRASTRGAFAVLGGFVRRGAWTMPRRFRALAFMGGGNIDLREANFEEREVTIRAIAVMGGVSVTVPPEIEVEVRGFGLMGGFDQNASRAGAPGAPRVVITGFAFWGGVGIVRKKIKAGDDERPEQGS